MKKLISLFVLVLSFNSMATCKLFVHPNSEHNIIANDQIRDIIADKGYEIVSELKEAQFEIFTETKLVRSTGNQMLGNIFYTQITYGEYLKDNSGAHYQDGHASAGSINSISETLSLKLITCRELEQRLSEGDRETSKQIFDKSLELGIF